MTDEDPHGDLVALILVLVAAILLAAVVWLLMRKYRMDQVKSFECTPPRLASPIMTPQWDSSLLLGTDQLRQQPPRPASAQDHSASASKLTSTAADISQPDQSKLEAEDKSKPPPEAKARLLHRQQSGSTVLRDSKSASKRPARTKDAEAGRKRSRRTSATVREKSVTAMKRRSKHRRPERHSPEAFKIAASDRLSAPHERSSMARAAANGASTTAAAPSAAPASAASAAVRRNSTAAVENVAQDHPRKTSPGEELSPMSAAASTQQALTSPEARGEGNP